jgi:hypothetical protein
MLKEETKVLQGIKGEFRDGRAISVYLASDDTFLFEFINTEKEETTIRLTGEAIQVMHDIYLELVNRILPEAVPLIVKPSCFGKKLGVEACYNTCQVSDDCYKALVSLDV